jgi:DNA-binding GntR family transcriptional regulator
MRAATHTNASTRIADSIRLRIIEGKLIGGEKLAERDIAEEFGTSRVPVREACKVLESEGYLEVRPRSGTMVKPMERKYMRTVGDVYVALIPLIILHALPHYNEKLLKKAEEIIQKLDDSKEPIQTVTLLTELRDLLHSPSVDTYAYKVCRDIYLINRRVLTTVSHNLFAGKFPIDGYKKFIRLIRAKEYDEAVMVYQDTVRSATANIQRIIEANEQAAESAKK